MRRLMLMRHAKAELQADTDEARALAPRGRADARAAGALLAGRGEVPELALVSTALRARDTWDSVCSGLGSVPESWFDRTLYDGGAPAVVELLAAVAEDVLRVVVVGHNPSISVAAAAFSDGSGDARAETAVADGMPTAALACFDVPVAWEDVNARRLRLTSVDVPRG